MSVFPLRAIFMLSDRFDDASSPVRILVSVPKKRFKRAVDRNRMKRQIRECYRLNKQELWQIAEERKMVVDIAFICITDEPVETMKVARSMRKILGRIVDNIVES